MVRAILGCLAFAQAVWGAWWGVSMYYGAAFGKWRCKHAFHTLLGLLKSWSLGKGLGIGALPFMFAGAVAVLGDRMWPVQVVVQTL